jgi:hypothetical protein
VSEVIVMRGFVPLLVCALVASVAGTTASAAGKKKLYRWTDENGEVHYTDALPPEAANAARDQLNTRGQAVERTERAMTPEERAVFEAERQRLEQEKRLAEERAKMDAILLASYPTEADLARAYKERFELLERTLESAQVGIGSQERSLDDLLNHAAGLERSGKPVPDKVAQSIAMARRQVAEQRTVLTKRQAEKAALQAEYDQVLGRYRELAAPAAPSAAAQEG